MSYFIFAGDMLVMAFMMIVVVWIFLRQSRKSMDEASRIPLEDERIND